MSCHEILQQLQHPDIPEPLVGKLVNLYHSVGDSGWILSFQWIPSDSGIHGNERANAFAAYGHTNDSTVVVDLFAQLRGINREHGLRHHPHDDVARGCLPVAFQKCHP